MDDDDRVVDAAIRPVLPSRAAIPAPMFEDLPKPPRKATRLPPAEIKRINTNRKKNMKKPKLDRSALAKVAWKTRRANLKKVQPVESPLGTIIKVVGRLSQDELGGFLRAIEIMSHLSADGRKVVIKGLSEVYP